MTIKITKPVDAILTENLIIVLYGQPGVGKTSLSFTTNRPILFDFDLGAQRALNRKDVVRVNKWADLINLTPEDVEGYDTIVIDTAGRLLESMTQFIISINSKMENKANGGLSLQGYGLLNTMFKNFINKLKSCHKDIILICHDKEDKQGDNLIIRPDAVGSSKSELIKMADLLGYVFMEGKSHMLDFNPTDKYIGKNCAQIATQTIPNLSVNKTYLAGIMEVAKSHMNNKTDDQRHHERAFDHLMDLLNATEKAEDFTELTTTPFVQNNHAAKQAIIQRTQELGLIYNKDTKSFVAGNTAKSEPKVEENKDYVYRPELNRFEEEFKAKSIAAKKFWSKVMITEINKAIEGNQLRRDQYNTLTKVLKNLPLDGSVSSDEAFGDVEINPEAAIQADEHFGGE